MQLIIFGILAGRCGNTGERQGYERSWSNPGLRFSFFLKETLSITGQKFSKCLKNGSDRLRKGQLPRTESLLKRNNMPGALSVVVRLSDTKLVIKRYAFFQFYRRAKARAAGVRNKTHASYVRWETAYGWKSVNKMQFFLMKRKQIIV